MQQTEKDILNFWFQELTPSQWFTNDPNLDQEIKNRFLETHQQAATGGLKSWQTTPQGRLAEVIVLDQFSRNIYRNLPEAFACDDLALSKAQKAIDLKQDLELTITERSFLYMPFMHSESAKIHQQALKLFNVPGLENSLDFERRHKKIIDRFGRYPHRNKILGRSSTPEELEFLKQPNSSF